MVCYVSKPFAEILMFSKKILCADCGTESVVLSAIKVRCSPCQSIRAKAAGRGYMAKWRLKVKGTGKGCPRCLVAVDKPGVCERCAAYVKKWKEANAEKYKVSNRSYKSRVKAVGMVARGVGENVGLSCGLVLKRLVEQGYRCAYCACEISFENSNIDHKTPTSRGGDNADWNVQMLCVGCNQKKGVMTDGEYRAYLSKN